MQAYVPPKVDESTIDQVLSERAGAQLAWTLTLYGHPAKAVQDFIRRQLHHDAEAGLTPDESRRKAIKNRGDVPLNV